MNDKDIEKYPKFIIDTTSVANIDAELSDSYSKNIGLNENIKNILNKCDIYKLYFSESENIIITVYYNSDIDTNIKNNNIKKIMTRIYNLINLCDDFTVEIFGTKYNPKNVQFRIYLYNR